MLSHPRMDNPSVKSSELLLASTRIEQLLKNLRDRLPCYVDMHIHSKYSRATSADMTLENIAFCARLKGLKIVGTGDCTHPRWLKELKEKLVEAFSGLYMLKSEKEPEKAVLFLIQGEVSTIYRDGNAIKRIHHVLLFPDFETVEQVCDALKHIGDIRADGRPLLECSSPELVEILKSVSDEIEIFPAHVWTPHFSIFGIHGYNSVKECYKDKYKEIHALETGLSSDPLMNWRVSSNDRYTLVSNSDSHSHYPWRLGREANLMLLEELSYKSILNAVRKKGKSRIILTIETHPEYGKYHYPGHRGCSFYAEPDNYFELKGICPICGKRLTPGVETHIEELADRPRGVRPRDASDYVHLIPLSEIIGYVYSIRPSSKKAWNIYYDMIRRFGNEYSVLLETPLEDLGKYDKKLAYAIRMVREDRVRIRPGYDGVYGEIEGFINDNGIIKFMS
ncbi:MAG: DNA helicase UvrD [Candidatus Brockarchaeota archaeon]|nr:DNA helicase UvrD [Candidatus Brockarchaeota archaeon]